ncbi:MAG: 30S ribosomal protein S14 [Rhizobiales bacterium]|nr:30S ribosomal protein S14 [Hyphomicrobiales bacterium]NRB13695.1 30S ribosomal protein S14 [Hyphomicrobiales bacterium]
MAKVSMIQRELKRQRIVAKYATKRAALVAVSKDSNLKPEERFKARMDLAKLPRNGSKTRLKNRCEVTGRPRGYYRKLKMSRIALRELGSQGKIPGLVKSSW